MTGRASPDGRRLTDEILQVAEGSLIYNGTFGGKKAPTAADAKAFASAGAGLGDDANDKPFLRSFPYIADPNSGSAISQVKPAVRFYQNLNSYRGKVYVAVGGIPSKRLERLLAKSAIKTRPQVLTLTRPAPANLTMNRRQPT